MTTTFHPWEVLDPVTFANDARFQDFAAWLRHEQPLCHVDHPDVRPFWIVSKHADIKAIERDAAQFVSGPRTVCVVKAQEDVFLETFGNPAGVETLVHMDGEKHKKYRGLTYEWFLPRNLKNIEPRVKELAKYYVDKMVEVGPECDFARDVALRYPLHVIMSILGVPEDDFPLMLRLTQELFGAADEELRRGAGDFQDGVETLQEFGLYFGQLVQDRQANPKDDVATVIANATIDDEPIGMFEAMSYYIIIATAGHDTTSSSIAGGLCALLENPDEFAKLKADLSLLPTAAEEIFRWTTPVKHFMRTCVEPCEIRGQVLDAGESLMLLFASANRDEDVFEDPYTFKVDRSPNDHLAFGYGAHFCLGKYLAKMELEAFFNELLPRLDEIELNGEPALTASTFVSGHKHLPIRFRMR